MGPSVGLCHPGGWDTAARRQGDHCHLQSQGRCLQVGRGRQRGGNRPFSVRHLGTRKTAVPTTSAGDRTVLRPLQAAAPTPRA